MYKIDIFFYFALVDAKGFFFFFFKSNLKKYISIVDNKKSSQRKTFNTCHVRRRIFLLRSLMSGNQWLEKRHRKNI